MSPVNDVTGTLIEALQRPSAYPAPVGAVEVIENDGSRSAAHHA